MLEWEGVELSAIARQIMWAAAALVPDQSGIVTNKSESSYDPVTATDMAINHYVLAHLQAVCGDRVGYLSEETADDRRDCDQVWILDPLDGTREFIEGRWEFAIHLALVVNQRPQLGLVALPRLNTLFWAVAGQGAWLETPTTPPQQLYCQPTSAHLRVCVSRSHRGAAVDAVLAALPQAETVPLGGLGCKLVAIAASGATPPLPAVEAYVGVAEQSAPKDWDLAAPDLVLTEAGGQITDFAGAPLRYNRPDIQHWGGILASSRSDHQDLCQKAAIALKSLT